MNTSNVLASDQTAAQHILVVDDDTNVARLLQVMLEADGHHVSIAGNGREALSQAAECAPDLILLDLDMPEMGGYEVCHRLKSDPLTRLIPIIILTGQNSFAAKLRAWELAADDFLAKPFQSVEVKARCRSLLRLKRLVDHLDSAQAVVFAFARAVEAKSPYTQGHAERVTAYALTLAARVGLPDAEQELLRRGGVLHDIGKISVPDAILNKPGALTAEEFEVVKRHPAEGVRIVESLHSIRDTIPLIRWHHERLDGRGYPDGLVGDAISVPVRVLSVADVYDALRSERPYRPAMPHGQCLEILCQNASGGGLDPMLVRCFCEIGVATLLDPAIPAPLAQRISA